MMTRTIWSETTGEGQSLVLIHGWGMNASVWDDVLPNLLKHFRVTRVDLPGHGLSREHILGNLEEVARDLCAVVENNSIVLGWSLGGLLATQMAFSFPEKVQRLLLVSSSPCFVRRQGWSYALEAEIFDSFEQGLVKDYSGTLRRFLGLQLKGVQNMREMIHELRSKLDMLPPDPRALRQGLHLLRESDLRLLLSQLGIPVFVLLGERDTLVPQKIAEPLRSECHVKDVEIVSGSAHVPFLTHQDQFVGWINQFANV